MAYGTQKKKDLTGSMTAVKAENIAVQNTTLSNACKALLKDNPELLDELEAKVREALAAKEQK